MAKLNAKKKSAAVAEESLSSENVDSQSLQYAQDYAPENEEEDYINQQNWYEEQKQVAQQLQESQPVDVSKLNQVSEHFASVTSRAESALRSCESASISIVQSFNLVQKYFNEVEKCCNACNRLQFASQNISSDVQQNIADNNLEFVVTNVRLSYQYARISQSKADEAFMLAEMARSLVAYAQKQAQTALLSYQSIAESSSSVQSLNRFMIEESQKSEISDEEYSCVQEANQISQRLINVVSAVESVNGEAQEYIQSASLLAQNATIAANEAQAYANDCSQQSNALIAQYNSTYLNKK